MLPKHYSLWNVTYFKPKIIIKYTHETLYTHILTHKKNNRVDVGSYPQHLSLHRTYGSRIRRYIHIGERKL